MFLEWFQYLPFYLLPLYSPWSFYLSLFPFCSYHHLLRKDSHYMKRSQHWELPHGCQLTSISLSHKYYSLGAPFCRGRRSRTRYCSQNQAFCLLLLPPDISAVLYNENLNHLCAHIATVYLMLALRTQWGFNVFRKEINSGRA